MPKYNGGALIVAIAAVVAAGLLTLPHGTTMVFGAGAIPARIGQEKVQGMDAELQALLSVQAADWNRGDIDAFMRRYW